LYVDHGKDFYAGITFNNEPTGRKIMIDWAKQLGIRRRHSDKSVARIDEFAERVVVV